METKSKKNTQEIKVDFNDSIKAIKASSKTVSTASKKVVTEVIEDIKINATRVTEYATTKAKSTINNTKKVIKENANAETITSTATAMNDISLKAAESVIDGVTTNTEKWSKLAEKAVNNGLKITAKQQDIFFETLVDVKGQVMTGVKRFKKIFSAN